jgi:hypothetical protein
MNQSQTLEQRTCVATKSVAKILRQYYIEQPMLFETHESLEKSTFLAFETQHDEALLCAHITTFQSIRSQEHEMY